MWTCPICKTEKIENYSCPKCQYRQSDHFEAFPTLMPLPDAIQALRRRYANLAAMEEDTLVCARCGGISFAVHLRQRSYSCLQCGKQIDIAAVWEEGFTDVEEPASTIPVSRNMIAAGSSFTAGICKNGTLLITDHSLMTPRRRGVATWKNIVSVAAGDYHVLGLKEDGTVVAAGRANRNQCNTAHWRNIVAISAGANHSAGLTADGTVKITEYTQAQEAMRWKNVVSISAGADFTLALFRDGSVEMCCSNSFIRNKYHITDWQNIVAVCAGDNHAVGIRKDGTVVATGWNGRGQCDTRAWKDITAVATGLNHTVGLCKDGTVVAVGSNDEGQCNVGEWREIIAIAAHHRHTVGLRKDGTVVATGANEDGQCEVKEWRDILTIDPATASPNENGLWNIAGNLV